MIPLSGRCILRAMSKQGGKNHFSSYQRVVCVAIARERVTISANIAVALRAVLDLGRKIAR